MLREKRKEKEKKQKVEITKLAYPMHLTTLPVHHNTPPHYTFTKDISEESKGTMDQLVPTWLAGKVSS